ncbi:MAG: hypothetical protein ABW184_06340 [Sphingobium sp.]
MLANVQSRVAKRLIIGRHWQRYEVVFLDAHTLDHIVMLVPERAFVGNTQHAFGAGDIDLKAYAVVLTAFDLHREDRAVFQRTDGESRVGPGYWWASAAGS